MNREFTDARYYLRRAGEHTIAGLRTEAGRLRDAVSERFGEEPEERSRVDRVRDGVIRARRRVGLRARRTAGNVRTRIETIR